MKTPSGELKSLRNRGLEWHSFARRITTHAMLWRLIFRGQPKPCWLVQSPSSCLHSDLLHSRDSPLRFWTYRLSCSDSSQPPPVPGVLWSPKTCFCASSWRSIRNTKRNRVDWPMRRGTRWCSGRAGWTGKQALAIVRPQTLIREAPPRLPAVLALEVESGGRACRGTFAS